MAFDLIPDAGTLGPSLHRSFRTSLDGPVSVILFNAVQALPDESWGRFVHDLCARHRALGRFDAESLRRLAPAATEAMERKVDDDGRDDGPVGPRTGAEIRMFRAALRLVDARDWVTLAADARVAMLGDPYLREHGALARDLAGRLSGPVEERTVLSVDGLDLASVASRDMVAGEEAVTRWLVDAPVSGAARGIFEDRAAAVASAAGAIKAARVDMALAGVDEARLAANVASFTPAALDPADPADAAVIARDAAEAGTGGLRGLLYRRRSAAHPEADHGDRVDYLFGGVDGGQPWLQGWRVRLSRGTGLPEAVEESFRFGESDIRERVARDGFAAYRYGSDADLALGWVEFSTVDDATSVRAVMARRVRVGEGPGMTRVEVASRETVLPGVFTELGSPRP